MPNWLIDILMVWNYRSRSYWLFLLGIIGYFLLPLTIDYYWSRVELQGAFAGMEEVFSSAQHTKYDKRGLIMLIGCWVSAYRLYRKDRKKLLGD